MEDKKFHRIETTEGIYILNVDAIAYIKHNPGKSGCEIMLTNGKPISYLKSFDETCKFLGIYF